MARGLCREIAPESLDLVCGRRDTSRCSFRSTRFRRPSPALIHERTEGNPLFMADLLRDLRRRQQVRQKDGRWVIADDLLVGRARAARVGPQR